MQTSRIVTKRRSRIQSGYTLLQIVIAVAISGILAALLAVAARSAVVRAKSKVSAENLRQIGIASALYANAYDDFLPPYLTHSYESGPLLSDGSHSHPAKAWRSCLLPYGLTIDQFFAPLDEHRGTYSAGDGLNDHLYSSYRHSLILSFYTSGKALNLTLTGMPNPAGAIHIYEIGSGQVRSPKDQRLHDVPYDGIAFEVLYFDGHVKRVAKNY